MSPSELSIGGFPSGRDTTGIRTFNQATGRLHSEAGAMPCDKKRYIAVTTAMRVEAMLKTREDVQKKKLHVENEMNGRLKALLAQKDMAVPGGIWREGYAKRPEQRELAMILMQLAKVSYVDHLKTILHREWYKEWDRDGTQAEADRKAEEERLGRPIGELYAFQLG